MNMLKFFSILIICVTMVFLCGCTSSVEDNPQSSHNDPTNSTTAVTDEKQLDTDSETTTVQDDSVTFTIYYDDYLTDINGIKPDSANVAVSPDSAIELTTVNGIAYFHAKEVGDAIVSDGTNEVKVTVEKAKLNIIVIMGQSNSGNHFPNATSDITCQLGTAYLWGNGKGFAAREPVDFTHATMGFHSTLLAELYAQSVKAGMPEKNVLVWHEGGGQNGEGTSKNGSSIYGWAKSNTDTSGTDYTVKMVNNCVKYYNGLADKYEIVSKGVYWLQGEGDGASRQMDPVEYTGCFLAMWNKLKTKAGLEYMAIMRVRRGGDNNTFNDDIHYSTTVSAQFALANAHPDIFIATTLTENFTGAPTENRSINISNYITLMNKYSGASSHNDSYDNFATYKDGVLTTSMKTLYGANNKCHYGKFGYTLIAADAAYNMYNALHSDGYSIVLANSSGRPEYQKISAAGDVVDLDITNMVNDLAFRASTGSQPGVISIVIKSGDNDITESKGILKTSGENYGCVSIVRLKSFDSAVITVTYTTPDGNAGSVIYNITNN